MRATALRLRVTGVVQGVGFRPFVYRLAVSMGLRGYVRNLGGAEVEIWVEGPEEAVRAFPRELVRRKPPSARIEGVEAVEVEPRGHPDFRILRSERGATALSMIPPDFGICEWCLREVLDERSRWYMYPFNSCAWCGPRFTMIEKIPYDRENTAMAEFPLCEECLREYEDPGNVRRFHAQGISCPRCGPRAKLLDADGEVAEEDTVKAVLAAARLVDEGYVVAVKGIGGFHLAALASDDDVVLELRRRKRRPRKPFALMALDVDVCRELVVLSREALELLQSLERPIMVLPKREGAPVSEHVAPGLGTLGVMLPYTAMHYMILMETSDKFLIMTSGNPPGLPICADEEEALERLRGIADYFLVHNRRIVNRADDSVIRFTSGRPCFLRRSRGYAPTWVRLSFELERPVVAVGAMLSNTGAVGVGEYAIPTQYVGDVDNLENLRFLERALNFLIKCYKVDLKACVVAADKHPLYPTRRLAERLAEEHGAELVLVQHHHAHVASAMADARVPQGEEVAGIAVDGVGYGDDGRAWGGEVLRAKYSGYVRVGHLRYQPLPGGDLATRYPVRSLVGLLSLCMDESELREVCERLKLAECLPRGEAELEVAIRQAFSGKSPLASSTGRFLDAVSAMLGVCRERTYEGEPAIALEAFARGGSYLDELSEGRYVRCDGGIYIVDTAAIVADLLALLGEHDPKSVALTAQLVLGRCLGLVALRATTRHTRAVVISGGAAVNDFIVRGVREAVGDRLDVLLPRRVPPGDGGISLGQVAVAHHAAQALR